MVAWARKYGIQSTIHTGGPSIPGSGLIDRDTVLEADADIIGHINGGHTSLPEAHVCELCERSSRAIEIVHNGNERVAIAAVQAARDLGQLHRVILGTDSPAGSGVQPLGILRMVSLLSSLGGIPAAQAIAMATGNTARIRNLDAGLIEVGPGRRPGVPRPRPAHRRAGPAAQHRARRHPRHRRGDDRRRVRCGRSRNTPPAERVPEVLGPLTQAIRGYRAPWWRRGVRNGVLLGGFVLLAAVAFNWDDIPALRRDAGRGALRHRHLRRRACAADPADLAVLARPAAAGGAAAFRTMALLRWYRESANALLPAGALVGQAAAARLLARRGIPGEMAGATATVDLTLEAVSQLFFTLAGVALLLGAGEGEGLLGFAAAGFGIAAGRRGGHAGLPAASAAGPAGTRPDPAGPALAGAAARHGCTSCRRRYLAGCMRIGRGWRWRPCGTAPPGCWGRSRWPGCWG